MAKPKLKAVEIYFNIFDQRCVVLFDCTPQEAVAWCNKKMPDTALFEAVDDSLSDIDPKSQPEGMTISRTKRTGNTVVWLKHSPFKDDYALSVLGHEACHVTYRILEYWNFEIIDATNELFAALQSCIVREVLRTRPKRK